MRNELKNLGVQLKEIAALLFLCLWGCQILLAYPTY